MKGLRVLVAEDESIVAASLVEQLRGLGHDVVGEAATCREVVRMAAETNPDVILMDIKMPDCDGIEAAREISQRQPVPVVFLTGHFDQHLLAGAVESGGMAYLLKPAGPEQLQSALSLARRRFEEMSDLRAQVGRLEEALEVRKLLSRAKGLLMAQHGLTEEEAHRRMQKEASRANLKLAEVARAILTTSSLLAEENGAPGCPSEATTESG